MIFERFPGNFGQMKEKEVLNEPHWRNLKMEKEHCSKGVHLSERVFSGDVERRSN